jgi:DNA-binding NarL/FixJ family response regulator
MTLRVLLVDDHPLVRGGLKALLESETDMSVVGEAEDGYSAISEAERLEPDVVVMDVSLPKLGGAEATQQIKKKRPEVKVLVLTALEERAYLPILLDAGASGYILKRAASSDLPRAIHAIAEGGLYLDPSMAAQVLPNAPRRSRSGEFVTGFELSEREAEVLRLIAQGHGSKEIATKLAVSARTIETYKTRAMEKLKLKNRADIVRYAMHRGWLQLS